MSLMSLIFRSAGEYLSDPIVTPQMQGLITENYY
jgi:hypothetical protein